MTSQFSVPLRQLRRQTELTQEDLAARAGLSVRTIRRLETGASAVGARLEREEELRRIQDPFPLPARGGVQ